MKKKQWIILIIIVIIAWIWATYFLYIKQSWQSKTEFGCQDFIHECYKKNFEFYAWGWHMYVTYPDWSTSLDKKANCPEDCSRYTEEHWYFKDKKKQEKYYDKAVKECEEKYKECIQDGDCRWCDRYWQPIHLRD